MRVEDWGFRVDNLFEAVVEGQGRELPVRMHLLGSGFWIEDWGWGIGVWIFV